MLTLQQTLHKKIQDIVGYAHNIVYQGFNDRNRYQLTENIFTKWQDGIVNSIYDLDQNIGILFDSEKNTLVLSDLKTLGPKGFYVDVNYLMPKAVENILHPLVVESYYLQGQNPVINIQTTVDLLIANLRK